MTIRPLNLQFDEHLIRQFAGHRGEKVPKELLGLPPTGLVVLDGSRPVCLGFMILCDNAMAIFTDFMSDPRVEKPVRNMAVQQMREEFCRIAKAKGIRYVTSFTKYERLAFRLETLGFKRVDKGFFQMGRVL